jgi:beta-lactam-binding protein with PASTA domain
MVTVPDVLSLQEAEAIAAMESVGLVLGSISLDNRCIDQRGTVLVQHPSAGPFVLVPGASFRLTVSSGRNAKGKPCVFE